MTDEAGAAPHSDEPEGGLPADGTLRRLFEQSPDCLILFDDAGDYVDVNPAAAALIGEPRAALRGRPGSSFRPPDVHGDPWRGFREGGSTSSTSALVLADGRRIDVEYTGVADIAPGLHLFSIRDVTERIRTQNEVAFQAKLLDQVDAAVVAVDLRGTITHFNEAAERLYGWTRDEALGTNVVEVVVADGEEDAARKIWASVQTGESWQGEFRVRRPDGESLVAWVLNAPIRDPDGAVAGYVGVAVDMTERRRERRQLERSEALNATMLASALDPVLALDGEGVAIEFNPAAEKTFGYTRDEVIGRDLLDLVAPPATRDMLRAELARYLESGQVWPLRERVELTGMRADGSEFPMEMAVTDARLADGSPVFTAYVRDITDIKRAEELLERRAMQQAAVADLGQRALAADGIAAVVQGAVATIAHTLSIETVVLLELMPDGDNLIVRAATGVDPELVGTKLVPSDPSELPGQVLASGRPLHVEDWEAVAPFHLIEPSPELGPRSGALVPVDRGDGEKWGVLGAVGFDSRAFTTDDLHFMQSVANVIAGAIQRERVNADIRHTALHDALTGLPNRTLFLDRLGHALSQTARSSRTLAVIFLDLDRFKLVNDSLGHATGDELLRAVAARIGEELRPGDTLARLAGDEFVLLCESVRDERDAVAVAERLALGFQKPFRLGERDQFVSASMGIALPRGRSERAEDLIRDADAAMYRAKERGRSRFELFDERMRVRTVMRMRTENDLRLALPEDQLEVYYQPVVSLAQGDLVGFEALLRWHHPRRGDIPPAEFIPVAEDSGLIIPIGAWVLEQAAQQAVRWRGRGGRRGSPLMIAVNLSAVQFAKGGLADEVATLLDQAALQPDELAVELTESVLMEETEAAVETLHALKGLGVRLILDDFGTGYSSLSYLERFPLDGIKIDRSFVAGLDGGGSAAIVTAIVSMARSLDLRVTAEGVESADQLELLRRLGCDYAQGFYFGRPGPPSAHADLFEARPREPRDPFDVSRSG
ncbi:MAG: hypothetical protein QOJ07_813 [Thermoleophilaceae bacterium]|nr:hypothetical protein [Thermoleophilaceae bacterium]